jgi:NADH-quinone oxidoreductase subunit N
VTGRRLVQPEVIGLGVLCAAASVFFGVYPSPLLDLAQDAGAAFTNLF